jgi:hypothetical protein
MLWTFLFAVTVVNVSFVMLVDRWARHQRDLLERTWDHEERMAKEPPPAAPKRGRRPLARVDMPALWGGFDETIN